MAILWTYTEQQTIKPMSPNFPKEGPEGFEKMAEEVQVQDLQELLGFEFYQDMIQNPTSTANAALLDGGDYVYNSTTYTFAGLKYVLAYFLFARYVKKNYIKDTYSGLAKKNYEDSRPVTKGENKNYHTDFRKIAFQYWKECELFIAANPSDYPFCNSDPLPARCWDRYNQSFCF